MTAEDESDVYINLSNDERRLMVLALNEYSGLAHEGSQLLPPTVGVSKAGDWSTYYIRLLDTIEIEGPLPDLDWARALFLTEASFGSELVGTGWEWEIGQSGGKHVLALRSLQDKIHTDERSRLLRENVTFPAPRQDRVGMRPRVHTNGEPVELDDDGRALMSTTLGAYVKSPRHGFGVLAPMAGQPTFDTWVTYVAKLHGAVIEGEDLVDLDWMRALFLTEFGFTSVLVGFGSQFRNADVHGIRVLRSLQITISTPERRALFRDSATYPWICSDDD